MKILRKKDEFKKMPDKSVDDVLNINRLIKDGWKYCPKKEYKEFFKVEPVKEVKEHKEKPVKEKKK